MIVFFSQLPEKITYLGFVSRPLFTHFLYKQRCQVLNRSTQIASRCPLTADDRTAVYRVCTNSLRTAAISVEKVTVTLPYF